MTATITFLADEGYCYNNRNRIAVKIELSCEGEGYSDVAARDAALTEAHRLFAALVVRPKERT